MEMEDKWFVFYEASHVFFHRSWTGQPVYRLTVVHGSNGYEVTEALSSINFTTDTEVDKSYQAKLLDFLISHLLLGESKLFPLPPGAQGLDQIHRAAVADSIAGTGSREKLHNTKKAWWRFW